MQFVAALLSAPFCASAPGRAAAAGGVVNVHDFGARGDGVHDDTAAFVAALGSGNDVFVPPAIRHYRIGRTLALSRPAQRVFGDGDHSHIVQQGAGTDATVFVTSHPGCVFERLHISPGTSVRHLAEGWGVLVIGADGVVIRGCRFSGMRRGGVGLQDANECQVVENLCVQSVVRGDGSEPQSETGYDIYLSGASSRNFISANHCLSGAGVGIGCQTAMAGKWQSGNIISNNTIRGQPCYGIMIYGIETEQNIENFRIQGNIIEYISGSIHTDSFHYFYGAGIYVASGNHFEITQNTVRRTNTDRQLPYSSGAVPAAIAISGFGDGRVDGNTIEACYNGVMSVQTLPGGPRDRTVITNNTIANCHHTGILLLDSVGAEVSSNRLSGGHGSAQGIYASPILARHRGALEIADNVIDHFPIGVEVRERTPRARILRNQISNGAGYAIYCAADDTVIESNRVRGGRGIALGPEVKRGSCRANVVEAHESPISNHSAGKVLMDQNTIVGAVC